MHLTYDDTSHKSPRGRRYKEEETKFKLYVATIRAAPAALHAS